MHAYTWLLHKTVRSKKLAHILTDREKAICRFILKDAIEKCKLKITSLQTHFSTSILENFALKSFKYSLKLNLYPFWSIYLSTSPCLKTPTSKKYFSFTLLHWKYIYHIYSICAAPSNCAALHYYSKGFILISGNNVNCTTPSNSTTSYFLWTLINSALIPEVFISISV